VFGSFRISNKRGKLDLKLIFKSYLKGVTGNVWWWNGGGSIVGNFLGFI